LPAAIRGKAAPDMRGLLLVDHGSRRAAANAQLADMADRVARLRPQDLVGHAHMELAEPDIAAGVADLARRGAATVILLPYFLTDGRHATDDIPRLAAAAGAAHGLSVRVGAVLGPHDALAALLLERSQA
jgi:sirohydrochlorin ferrochelatase